MPCLKHTDGSGPDEHFIYPFEPCQPVPCPCPGACNGTLKFEQFNIDKTLAFLICSVCRCCHAVGMEGP